MKEIWKMTENLNVSMIGLGVMGAALAHELNRKGHQVTVWNRTSAKAESLVKAGATLAPSVAEAVAASPVVLICVADDQATKEFLGTDDVRPALEGKVIVGLSSGTPEDARNLEAWMNERGALYLDGAILATPSQIGRPDTTIFLSGSAAALERSEPYLKSVAGNLIYMGESAGTAAAWDLATLSCIFGAIIGFMHGARIIETEKLPVADFGAMIAELSPVIGEMIKQTGDVIHAERYDSPESTVRTCTLGTELFVKQAREAGINAEFPNFSFGLFQKAIAAGYGEEELGAVIKVMRATR
jgi:3-hydroxyisobutyrate dehydrogenase-like beta-hydroxyacid dehydrogenase